MKPRILVISTALLCQGMAWAQAPTASSPSVAPEAAAYAQWHLPPAPLGPYTAERAGQPQPGIEQPVSAPAVPLVAGPAAPPEYIPAVNPGPQPASSAPPSPPQVVMPHPAVHGQMPPPYGAAPTATAPQDTPAMTQMSAPQAARQAAAVAPETGVAAGTRRCPRCGHEVKPHSDAGETAATYPPTAGRQPWAWGQQAVAGQAPSAVQPPAYAAQSYPQQGAGLPGGAPPAWGEATPGMPAYSAPQTDGYGQALRGYATPGYGASAYPRYPQYPQYQQYPSYQTYPHYPQYSSGTQPQWR